MENLSLYSFQRFDLVFIKTHFLSSLSVSKPYNIKLNYVITITNATGAEKFGEKNPN